MSILSIEFLIFVVLSLGVYYVLPLKWRWMDLLVASVVFFLYGCGVGLTSVMLAMMLLAWAAGYSFEKLDQASKEGHFASEKAQKIKRNILVGTILVEALVLILYKDLQFFTDNISRIANLIGINLSLETPQWIAPLAISYWTLMLISYLLDIAWGLTKAEKNPCKVLLYTIYFPQMTSGPFTRFREISPLLLKGHRFEYENFCFGLQRILWGIFKNLVISERLSILVNTLYSDYEAYSGLFVVIAAVCYVLQLYTNFSGSMDIVIGVSQLFGVQLPENFHTPFYSTSLSEVWRRWHMTLGFWIKDYILYPVLKSKLIQQFARFCKKRFGKKVAKTLPTQVGLIVPWFFIGFWHGGSWKYICASGLFFYIMIVGGQLLQPIFDRIKALLKINTECFSWVLFSRIRTFILFTMSVSVGRALSLKHGIAMWKQCFAEFNFHILFDGSLANIGLDKPDLMVLVVSLLVLFVISLLQQKGSVREMLARQNLVFRWGVILALIFSILIFGYYGPGYDATSFIYGQF